jgi:hypothetical protein
MLLWSEQPLTGWLPQSGWRSMVFRFGSLGRMPDRGAYFEGLSARCWLSGASACPRFALLVIPSNRETWLFWIQLELPLDRRRVEHFRYGPGIFKIDYARDGPLPWIHEVCQRLEPFIWGEHSMRLRKQRPRLLTANARTDRSCCFPNRHYSMLRVRRRGGTFLWAYCHVPNGSSFDMTERVGEADWSLRAAVL